jgi:RHS repeat-associated protein
MTNTPYSGGAPQAPTTYTYGYDVHGSASQLLDPNGATTASYGYRPYGQPDTDLSKGDTSDTTPLNPFRYTAKRFDSGSETYDMGARRFGPDTSRFLNQDLFHGALANLGLAMDPLTANRYALAAGNPVSYSEWDGHLNELDGGGSAGTAQTDSAPSFCATLACARAFTSSDGPSKRAGRLKKRPGGADGRPQLPRKQKNEGGGCAVIVLDCGPGIMSYEPEIMHWASEFGIDPSVLAAVIHHEGGNIRLFGDAWRTVENVGHTIQGKPATVGIGQINPDTAWGLLEEYFGVDMRRDVIVNRLIYDDRFSIALAAAQLHHVRSEIAPEFRTNENMFVGYALSDRSIQQLNDAGWESFPGLPKARRRHDVLYQPARSWVSTLQEVTGAFGGLHPDYNTDPFAPQVV